LDRHERSIFKNKKWARPVRPGYPHQIHTCRHRVADAVAVIDDAVEELPSWSSLWVRAEPRHGQPPRATGHHLAQHHAHFSIVPNKLWLTYWKYSHVTILMDLWFFSPLACDLFLHSCHWHPLFQPNALSNYASDILLTRQHHFCQHVEIPQRRLLTWRVAMFPLPLSGMKGGMKWQVISGFMECSTFGHTEILFPKVGKFREFI
jgi:hypothetical protein